MCYINEIARKRVNSLITIMQHQHGGRYHRQVAENK